MEEIWSLKLGYTFIIAGSQYTLSPISMLSSLLAISDPLALICGRHRLCPRVESRSVSSLDYWTSESSCLHYNVRRILFVCLTIRGMIEFVWWISNRKDSPVKIEYRGVINSKAYLYQRDCWRHAQALALSECIIWHTCSLLLMCLLFSFSSR